MDDECVSPHCYSGRVHACLLISPQLYSDNNSSNSVISLMFSLNLVIPSLYFFNVKIFQFPTFVILARVFFYVKCHTYLFMVK